MPIAYIAALLLIGVAAHFIERRYEGRWPLWLIPGALFLAGIVLAFKAATEPVDLGPMLIAMVVLWPAAVAFFLGGLSGRGRKARQKDG